MEEKTPETGKTAARTQRKSGGLGLRSKMFILFLLIPLILMSAAAVFFLWQMDQTVSNITTVSSDFVSKMAEEKIADLSAAVAMQCRLYLMSNPSLKKEDFISDMAFKTLAVQKVGLTGYTALYEIPGSDGKWRTWAHVNPKIIGIDMSNLKKTLKESFDGFWKIYIAVKDGQRAQGYYRWQDKDGRFRDKFMVCTPVAGTPFVIAATTYLDEFTQPIQKMQAQTKMLTDKARIITLAILGGTILLIFIIVFVYADRLTRKIRSLTDVAERISIGDMAIEIDTKSRDEIGDLAEAIDRMQDSIRLSIERLRRRR
jgi:HAMP domain-containing protein